MRIVLDTNVVVAALLNADGNPAVVLDLVLTGAVDLVYSEAILDEYREVLGRPKFGIGTVEVMQVCDDLAACGSEVDPSKISESPLAVLLPHPSQFPDPDDAVFAAVGILGEADVLVTGNKKHFAKVVRPAVMSPAEFLAFFGEGEREDDG